MIEPGTGARDFVPRESLRRKTPAPPPPASLASVTQRLHDLSAELSEGERAVLSHLLGGLDAKSLALEALAALPAEAILTASERAIYGDLLARPAPVGDDLPPSLAMIMKGTRLCNLRCTYCRSWAEGPDEVMPFEVLARGIQSACLSPGVQAVEFIWHGGETTLRPIDFYRKALWLQQRFRRPRQHIANQIQTNGTHLTPAWLDFLATFAFDVGVSLDGPPEVHDLRRLDVHGRPTSARVREGIERLRARGIRFEIKMVVDDAVIDLGPRRVLDYLLEIGVDQVALLNVVPEGDPERKLPGDYLEFARYVEFLRQLFLLWWPEHVHRLSFREISDVLTRLEGGRGTFCVFDENCMGGVFTLEPQGQVAACDLYQGDPEFQFGDLRTVELSDLPRSARLSRAHAETAAEMARTAACRWYPICHGGCPHDRYTRVHRHAAGAESCCGWYPLLDEMASALNLVQPSDQPERSDVPISDLLVGRKE